MTHSFQIRKFHAIRRIEHAWRYGDLIARSVWIAAIVLLLTLTISIWQGRRLQATIEHLQARTAKLQSDFAAKSSLIPATESADFAQMLPDAPSAAQIMQTLQQAAAKEGASVASLQADDHLPTRTMLGHLDLAISIKASYPAILVVLQQTLDRYPGATVRQFNLAHIVAPTGVAPMAPFPQPGATALQAVSEADAHLLLSFWRRPLGVASRIVEPATTVAPAAAAGSVPESADAVSSGVATAISGTPAAAAPVAAQSTSGGR